MDNERALLAAIVDSSDDAIVGKTLDGVITSWNAGALKMFGYTAEEAIGRHISLIIPPERLAEEETVLARLRRGEKIDHFETVRRRKDGRRIDISLTVSPIRGQDGSIVGASKVARDITERHAAHRAIARSQRRYRRLFESAGVSLWEEDFTGVKAAIDEVIREGVTDFREYVATHPVFVDRCIDLVRVIDVNRTTLRMFGAKSKTELLPSISALFHEYARDVFAEQLIAIADGRTVFESEVTFRTLSGERLDAVLSLRFPEDSTPADSESFDTVLVSLTDITERRMTEQALRDESSTRETLAQVGASLAAELDPERLAQAVTDAATKVTGASFGAFYDVTRSASEGPQLSSLSGAETGGFAGLPSARDIPVFPSTMRGEAIIRLDDVTKDPRYERRGIPSGRYRMRSYLAVPIVSRSREPLGLLVFGHPQPGVFSERHEELAKGIAAWAAIALDNARLFKAAQDANATKDEFLATLSHELRTPLNAMLGWAHLLRSGTLASDMQQRALEALERNGRAQAQLVDDLLDVSRIVSGRLQIRADEVDLGAVLGSAMDTVRPAATAKSLDVRMLLPDSHVLVTGDADRLRQIFWNLLSNAVKFTAPQGRIDVEMRAAAGEATVVVRDTGLGIRQEFLAHVFERFRQADSTHSRRHGGLGLGLAIVRHLVEAHGGAVSVDSPGEGKGATFSVRLPARAAHQARPLPDSLEPARGARLAGLKILVVDDERDAREFLGALLALHGAETEIAASAGEALDIMASWRPQILLADLGLPDRDGYALIEAVRALEPSLASIPAVAVTAYAGTRERARAFEAGYGWHVAKPVDPDQMLTVVAAAARTLQDDSNDTVPVSQP